MEKAPDPFRGMKLSEAAPIASPGRDQRLFAPTPRPATEPANPETLPVPVNTEIRKAVKPVSRQPGNTDIQQYRKPDVRKDRKPASRQPGNAASAAVETSERFSINQEPSKKETFWCAQAESEALEDLKLQLRRQLDIRASKQDIVRCAIQLVAETFAQDGEQSALVTRLRGKSQK